MGKRRCLPKFGSIALVLSLLSTLGCDPKRPISAQLRPPNPKVVSVQWKSANKFLEREGWVVACVRNDGGDGSVVVEAYATSKGRKVTKSEPVYMQANQTKYVEIYFTEASVLERTEYGAHARPQ